MLVGNYEKFCKDYHLCEGYAKAINSSEDYYLHHIQGENISKEELKEQYLYYDCEPENLRWVTNSEHTKIHMEGKVISVETRKKMSKAAKGRTPWNKGKKSKPLSEEHRRKMSDAHKGKTGTTKGMTWKIVDGKRKYFSK